MYYFFFFFICVFFFSTITINRYISFDILFMLFYFVFRWWLHYTFYLTKPRICVFVYWIYSIVEYNSKPMCSLWLAWSIVLSCEQKCQKWSFIFCYFPFFIDVVLCFFASIWYFFFLFFFGRFAVDHKPKTTQQQ